MLSLKEIYEFFDSIDFDFFLEENRIALVNSVEIADITGRTVFKTEEPFAAVEVQEGFPVIAEILTAVRKEIADCYLRHGYIIDRYKIVVDGDDEDMVITGLPK